MPASDARYAGLDRRLLAYFADILILYTVILIFQLGLRALTGGFPFDRLTTGVQVEAWVLLSVSLPTWLYFTVNEASPRGATPGKRAFRLRVAGIEGDRISPGRALLRTLVKLIPWELTHLTVLTPVPWWDDPAPGLRVGLVFVYVLLGVFMAVMIFHPRKQGPHDLLARTIVLRGDL